MVPTKQTVQGDWIGVDLIKPKLTVITLKNDNKQTEEYTDQNSRKITPYIGSFILIILNLYHILTIRLPPIV